MSPHQHDDGATWAGQTCQTCQPTAPYEHECAWCGEVFTDDRDDIPYCSARCERLDNEGDPRWRNA